MSPKYKSLVLCLILCSLLGLAGVYGLWLAYAQAERSAAQRASSTSYLIGEWIKGAFESSDYVLRDMIGDVSREKLDLPSPDCEFRPKLDSHSDGIWTVIPRQTGHRFRRNLDSSKS